MYELRLNKNRIRRQHTHISIVYSLNDFLHRLAGSFEFVFFVWKANIGKL